MSKSSHVENVIEPPIDLEESDSRKKLAMMLIKLFEHWELDQRSQLNVLGLSEQSRRDRGIYSAGHRYNDPFLCFIFHKQYHYTIILFFLY